MRSSLPTRDDLMRRRTQQCKRRSVSGTEVRLFALIGDEQVHDALVAKVWN